MKSIKYLLLVFILTGCSPNPKELLPHIEGYWEIEEVTLADGSKKVYEYNDTIDYIAINDSLKGFRKKLKPSFNNKYTTSEDAEALTVKIENDSLNLYYKTPFSSWKETVLEANDTQLKIVNQDNSIYLYKRYEGLELDLED
ncbi:lipocalin family protein [Winogradskyella sp. A3E31]|uniref:lipocalin family protein n=1 Tax=Winogradskyella sp. A3E31 TaxID=3349637 RepID=UPI00398A5F63